MPSTNSSTTSGLVAKSALAVRFLTVSAVAGALLAGMALPFVGGLGLGAKAAADSFDSLPDDFKAPALSQASSIYDASGNLIATAYDRDRTVVPGDQIAPVMRQALVDIEDNRFYQHGAIDPKGIIRALSKNSAAGGTAQGASTLTQQYVKNVFVDEAGNDTAAVLEAQRQTIGRKLQEMRYAIDVEQTLTKDQILTNYLNITFFGEQAYGIEAASERYFSVHAKDLTLPQAAMLAGLVQSPSTFDPIAHLAAATDKRNVVLKKMAEYGAITQAQADQAIATPIKLQVSRPQQGCITAKQGEGFFCDYVKAVLLSDPVFGATAADRKALWNRGGLQIHTTLDPKAQVALDKGLADNANASDKPAAVMSMVQPNTGKILAMGQSRPYGLGSDETQINLNAPQSMGGGLGFPTGSTFKPIVAAAALESGKTPSQTYTTASTINWPRMTDCNGGLYRSAPSVHNDSSASPVTFDMADALAQSINTYFATLEGDVGLCAVAQMANRLGIEKQADGTPLKVVPSMTLGVNDLTPLTMASAYATFASHGVYCAPLAIGSVTGPDGKNLPVPAQSCSQVISPNTADTITAMLKGVVQDRGTASNVSLGRPIAGKTGTTDGGTQVWFVGYTPDVVGATVVSDTGKQQPLEGQMFGGSRIEQAFGAQVAGPIWEAAMKGEVAGTPATDFPDIALPASPAQSTPSTGPSTPPTP
ncbi:membrane peptidoglycan carboxypeptidase [Kitasatospora sp. MAP12-15]|uniref:transglycosylase domain-containing protein n=1 Tax=unclassified Kitasatospora TaxID=2633591 RepID=UPI002477135D|nr:transglycosylase domain-containing protein [Kitasatospora sp. MAP12-44]MDH6112935.1 membrane peptidoglycan carboxypeptidase [Kitasatospora sp. MAP12-44]